MNPNPKKHTLPRPKATLSEPFDDLFGNLESKVLLLNIICNSAIDQNIGIVGHSQIDIINASDLLRTEIMEGLHTIQQNFSCL